MVPVSKEAKVDRARAELRRAPIAEAPVGAKASRHLTNRSARDPQSNALVRRCMVIGRLSLAPRVGP
jgi:hypothetical protein